MAICKDCLHVEVCDSRCPDPNNERLICDNYKDRSQFVELPCKVYTTFLNRVVEAKIYGYEASIKYSNSSWTMEPQHFGKYVFFTREEAEQALKEREGNG